MSKISFSTLLAAGVLLVMLAVAATKAKRDVASDLTTSAGVPTASPAWELKDVNGKTVTSADFKDKAVLLDFWATWCPPCRAEVPGFIELQNKYKKQGLAVVGVALDQTGAEVVKKFIEKAGINYPVVLGNDEVVRSFGGVEAIPTTFIIDRLGRLIGKHEGFADKEEFEKEIKPLLKP